MTARSDLSRRLDLAHKLISRAAFLVVMQIVRRRFRRADTEEALSKCREAVRALEQLLG